MHVCPIDLRKIQAFTCCDVEDRERGLLEFYKKHGFKSGIFFFIFLTFTEHAWTKKRLELFEKWKKEHDSDALVNIEEIEEKERKQEVKRQSPETGVRRSKR